MTREELLENLERIHCLIRRTSTGRPSILAKKLGVSERTVFNLIAEMKRMGAPIVFNRERGSYCYLYEVEFVIGFISLNDKDNVTF